MRPVNNEQDLHQGCEMHPYKSMATDIKPLQFNLQGQ